MANERIADPGSVYAQEGTEAHRILAACLSRRIHPSEYTDTIMPTDMSDALATAYDYVSAMPGEKSYEQKVDYSEWVPDGYGTADIIAYDTGTKTLHVADYKHGKGVEVQAESNAQLMLYGLGAYAERAMLDDIQTVALHIIQPRRDHIDTWSISVPDLLAWGEWVRERAALAMQPDAPRVPGDAQCRWCRAAGSCAALHDHTAAVIGREFDDLDRADLGSMTEEQTRIILENAPLIRAYLSAVEDRVHALLLGGGEFPGWKLVEGRSIRKWSDVGAAESALVDAVGDAAWEKSLLSPAKAEKMLGKKKVILKDLIEKPAGKPTLAPEADKRPALGQAICEKFETVET
jgi:hypothetical protein